MNDSLHPSSCTACGTKCPCEYSCIVPLHEPAPKTKARGWLKYAIVLAVVATCAAVVVAHRVGVVW